MPSSPRHLAPVLIGVLAAVLLGCIDQDITLTIQADGQCVMTTKMAIDRARVESHILKMRAAELEELDEEEEETEEAEPPKKQKPLTDEELVKGVRERFAANVFPKCKSKLDSVEVKKDKVHVAYTLTYATVKDMVLHVRNPWREFGLYRTVVDKDDKGNLRITHSAAEGMRRGPSERLDLLVAMGFKTTYRMVLPGKVLKSSLPNTKDNATWISVDSRKKESLDALRKIIKSPVVITAEMGGLALKELPLDSEELAARRWRTPSVSKPKPQLPITDAGPGFLAEATMITTTTVYHFPEGKRLLGDVSGRFARDSPGLVIRARLYAPRGRQFLEVEKAHAIKAIDDRRRTVQIRGELSQHIGRTVFSSADEEAQTFADLQFRLQLPKPDAEAIEKLACEAVVLTFGKWKSQVVKPLKADPKKEIDLAAVLPDAKLVITKAARKGARGRGPEPGGQITLKVTGPPAIAQLKFRVTVPGLRYISCHNRGDDFRLSGPTATRSITLDWSSYGGEAKGDPDQAILIVRYPHGLKRQRVKFTLEDLDLF